MQNIPRMQQLRADDIAAKIALLAVRFEELRERKKQSTPGNDNDNEHGTVITLGKEMPEVVKLALRKDLSK